MPCSLSLHQVREDLELHIYAKLPSQIYLSKKYRVGTQCRSKYTLPGSAATVWQAPCCKGFCVLLMVSEYEKASHPASCHCSALRTPSAWVDAGDARA